MAAADARECESWSPRRMFAATLVAFGVILGFAIVYLLRNVLFLLFIGIVLATALRPLLARIEARGLGHGAAVSLLYLAFGGVVISLLAVSAPFALDEAMAFSSAAPESYRQFRGRLQESPSALVTRLAARMPAELSLGPQRPQEVDEALLAVWQTVAYASVGLKALLAVAAVLLFAFYWSLHEERIIRWLLLLAPPERREAHRELLGAMLGKVGAYVLGQGFLCLIIGTMSLVAYLLIGLPYALLLALVAGALELIPNFGPVLGAVPALAVALATDPTKAIWVVVATLVIQTAENYLLVPRVMDRSVGVHPIVTLLAIAGFGTVMGVTGAILAIPLAAIIQLLLERWLLSPAALEPAEPLGRGQLSVLRYQLQELIQDVRLHGRHKPDEVSTETDHIEDLIESVARDLDRGLGQRQQSRRGGAV